MIALITFYLWEKTVFIDSEEQLYWYLFVHFGVIVVSIISLKWTFLPKKLKALMWGLITVSLFYIVFISWNIVFRWYSDTFAFKGNIFRGIFYGFRAPFYGRPNLKIVLADYYPLIISSVLFIILVFTIKWNKYSKWTETILLFAGALLFFSFAWDTSIHKTLVASNCHYKTFSEGLAFFTDWPSFLPSYIDQMKNLGAHNNHYPPGVLMLLKFNNESFPYLFKIIVLSAPLVSIYPLKGILKHFSIPKERINIYIAFYISTFALLFFPGTSITPLHLPFATSFLYFLIRSIYNWKISYGIFAGLILAIYAFFSFSFIVFALFCFVYLALLLLYKKIELQQLLLPALIIITTFVVIYIAINLLFDFNLYSCFNVAFSNESAQMKSSGLDNLTRYFIVSSGNLIAYIGILGPIIIGLFAERFYSAALKQNTSFNLIIKSALLTIIILSFSGQFHLEVERIWIFLTPIVLFGVLLYKPDQLTIGVKKYTVLRIALTLNILISIVYSIMINKCI